MYSYDDQMLSFVPLYQLIVTFVWTTIALSEFCTISKFALSYSVVTTMLPTPSASQLVKHNTIKDIIYCSEKLSYYSSDTDWLNDDHFCSILCDRGFNVHILSTSDAKQLTCSGDISQVMSSMFLKPLSSIVVGQDVTVPGLVRALSSVSC